MKTQYTAAEITELCKEYSFIELLFTAPMVKREEKKIKIRKIVLKGAEYYQIERFKGTQTFHQNVVCTEAAPLVADFFSSYRFAECSGALEKLFFVRKKPDYFTLVKREPRTGCVHTSHDAVKNMRLSLEKDAPFLYAQGITGTSGRILKEKYHKFRQINKFLEFIESVVPIIEEYTEHTKNPFPILDFGCGKAYLTFALYYYLHEHKQLPVAVHGVDLKDAVISQCRHTAEECGYTDLTFSAGDIAEYAVPEHTGMMVCLHACNTATDYALAGAVIHDVPIIFAVPCCQHELHEQLKKKKTYFKEQEPVFLPFLEHGIITAHFSSLLTDTLRALLLESCGYEVQVIEFIETDHTPKNVLIRAVKRFAVRQVAPESDSAFHRMCAYRKYRNLADICGVQPLLEQLLDEKLLPLRHTGETAL